MAYLFSVWPLLLCPLSMGVMMWVMMRGMSGRQHEPPARQPYQPYSAADPRLRSRDEIDASLLSDGSRGVETPRGATSLQVIASGGERYAALTARLADVEQQQQRLEQELAALNESSEAHEGVASGPRREA